MMNLLYIHTHDSGRYMQPYGYPVPSPNIMELARESVLFRNAFCCAPTCSPSRTAMLTGTSAHTSGMLGLAHRGFSMSEPRHHLSFYLKSQGYETRLFGVQHEAADAGSLGYGVYSNAAMKGKTRTDTDKENASAVCRFLREKHEKPFFVSFGMFNTHRPYPPVDPSIDPDYILPAWPLADTPANREDMAAFMSSMKIVDECVGRVLAALRESGRSEDTLVLFTTDHGIAMPHMKCSLYDTGTGVALMMRYPGNPGAGKVRGSIVSQVDVYPTICDILGVEKPEWLQGVSLLPVIRDDTPVREAVFSEVTYHAAYEPKRMVRTDRYKMIVHFDWHNRVVPANIDASAPKSVLVENGYLDTVVPKVELYDLLLDPVERINLAGDTKYSEVNQRLSRMLREWMEETDDPLLKYQHRVPKPKGARINLLEDIDPNEQHFEPQDV